MVHAFDNHNASLSEGAPLAAVVESLPGNPHWTRVSMDSRPPLRQRGARLRPACPRLARRDGAPHERGAGGGSDPPFCAAGAAPASVHRRTQWRTINTPLEGGRSLHSDPCGKAAEGVILSEPVTTSPFTTSSACPIRCPATGRTAHGPPKRQVSEDQQRPEIFHGSDQTLPGRSPAVPRHS